MTVTRRLMGTPPRWQPTVSGNDLYHWLYGGDLAPMEPSAICTLEVAVMLVEHCLADPAMECDPHRAELLLTWLKMQALAAD